MPVTSSEQRTHMNPADACAKYLLRILVMLLSVISFAHTAVSDAALSSCSFLRFVEQKHQGDNKLACTRKQDCCC